MSLLKLPCCNFFYATQRTEFHALYQVENVVSSLISIERSFALHWYHDVWFQEPGRDYRFSHKQRGTFMISLEGFVSMNLA